MKHYKSFQKVWIGCSDGSFLTFIGCSKDGVKAEIIKFGGDELINIYRAGEYGIIIHLVDEVNYDGSR